jgi:hypothetical protein
MRYDARVADFRIERVRFLAAATSRPPGHGLPMLVLVPTDACCSMTAFLSHFETGLILVSIFP